MKRFKTITRSIVLFIILIFVTNVSYAKMKIGGYQMGHAGIDRAIKEAGITKISHIDAHEKSIFIFWRKLTIIVYGE